MKVLIADSEWTFRNFISCTLGKQGDLTVIGEASDDHEVLHLAEQLRPDVVLMDMDLQGGSLDATRQIKARLPGTRIIMLSMLSGETWDRVAANCGADAFVPKGAPISRILAAIRGEKSTAAA